MKTRKSHFKDSYRLKSTKDESDIDDRKSKKSTTIRNLRHRNNQLKRVKKRIKEYSS